MTMSPEQEAAALWGSAQNTAYTTETRLVMALQALDFFGNEFDRDPRTLDALSETVARMKVERDAALAEVDRLRHKLGPNLLGPDMSTARRVE